MGKTVIVRTKSAKEWLVTLVKELMPVIRKYLNFKGKALRVTIEVVNTHRLSDYIDAAMLAQPPITLRTKEFKAVWTSEVRHRLCESDEHFYWKEAQQLLGVTRLEQTYSKVLNTTRFGRILSDVHDIMPD